MNKNKKKALLLVDIQNDYFPGGRNPLYRAEEAALNAQQILMFFRQKEQPIFHVQHISLQENAAFFLPNTDGCLIHKSVLPDGNESVVIKHTPDSFFQTNLQEKLVLNEIDELVICGMMSHMCIDTTVRSAKRLGYVVTVIADACTTRDLIYGGETIQAETVHRTFMAALNGTFAKVIDVSELN
ncbi:cysteine hydrolase family protein [Stenoxybacter acetivorans]|uniref:cysteine hydrolase family protein n=1 Tax=Stenoxybacter acetivorans TaxID=422441 RepID=UPI00056AC5E4|nr:cysteine hydrolase family protein [Stenoxybacter acetivorans]